MTTTMKGLARALVAAVVGFVGLSSSAATTYFHNDVAGSPVAATNEAGAVIWRESYRPYGERRVNSAAASDNKVWFTSRRQDVDTGLVYMGARYYDPVMGRFISTDPAGFDEKSVHSFNRYAYANNNPYRYVDPDGRKAEDWVTYFRLLMNPFTASFGQAGLDNGQFANASAGVQADMKAIGENAQSAAVFAASIAAPEGAMAARSAPYILSAVSYATRAEARAALVGEAGVAANQFFRGASSKAENFLVESLSDGSRRLQFFSPAKNEGFGKLYVQEISGEGSVLREYKDTLGPSGLLERKWVHGGPE